MPERPFPASNYQLSVLHASMATYYETLKVSQKASKTEIRSAYRRLARELHPDKNNGSEETARAFAAIAEAYEVLSSPKERAAYDKRILNSNNGSNGDSVFASSNTHARRWRQMVYEHRYNEIIDRMIAEERREAMALQRIIFPTVALLLSTLAVGIFKPQEFSKLGTPGVIVLATLFIVGLIHLVGRVREALDRYAYREDEIHDSIMEAKEEASVKPYSRFLAGSFLVGGVVICFGLGLWIGNYVDLGLAPKPSLFWLSNPEFLLYPPIFVLIVDIMHAVASRTEY